ncbi:radical SAM protein [Bacteroides sp.]|uniref:radical SAM protein n=1 Tax=Bacteroides sp. TaxID=29523 RepID=UPI002603C32E|nr:radical SAM protein [Bacteroides sp.]MDD3040549.1 radical SAM protein [Bacteroides sp.]
MIEFKSPVRLIGGAKGDHCNYPLQIDPYGNGCTNGCLYCYAHSLLGFRNHWHEIPFESDITKIRKHFEDAFIKNRTTKTAEMLKRRVPIRIGGMTDPFITNELVSRKMLELLQVFKDFEYPHIIFTKGKMVADSEYLNLYDPDLTYIQVSVTGDMAETLEPHAPSTQDRLAAVKTLVDANIRTAVRIAPIIPIWPDGTLSHEIEPEFSFNYFSFDFVEHVLSSEPNIVIGEMCRFSPFVIKQFESVGLDIRPLFNKYSIKDSATIFFSVEERLAYYERIKEICDSYNTDFSVCELNNFDAFKHLWAIPDDCCGLKGTIKYGDKTWWT